MYVVTGDTTSTTSCAAGVTSAMAATSPSASAEASTGHRQRRTLWLQAGCFMPQALSPFICTEHRWRPSLHLPLFVGQLPAL